MNDIPLIPLLLVVFIAALCLKCARMDEQRRREFHKKGPR